MAVINSPPPQSTVSISVVIPVYNGEQFIGECLDSLFKQTFQDFEVIVVDDGSTDDSVEIVKGYSEKFGERLKLVEMEEHSERPSEPRNKGISIAQGDYVYCLNSDDTIIETALEEMYNLAKEHVADVVYCENYYCLESVEEDVKNIRPATAEIQSPPFVDKPTLETEDLTERAKKLLSGNYWRSAALRLVRRDLLVDNDIKFPSLVGSEDDVWSMEILFCAKRFLRVPNRFFIRRIHDGGISFAKYTTPDKIQRQKDFTIRGLKETDNFLKKIPFFSEKPVNRYEILNRLIRIEFAQIFDSFSKESSFELCNVFQEKFGDSLSEQDVLIAGLCTQAINRQKELSKESKRRLAEKDAEINQLKAQLASLPTQSLMPAAHSNAPAISVIVPMYNVENYVGECLDSLLAQTFQNFEVIIVDDCSTDKSVDVVESYMSKFEGRLTLAKTKTNSGGAGIPRNRGIELARGEYLSFIDPDDTITPTAFEELYSEAKKINADVVQSEKWYQIPDASYHDEEYRKNVAPMSWPTLDKIFITEPTLLTANIKERVVDFCERRWLTWSACLQFVRREFIVSNQIKFANVYSEDLLFTMCELCCAKKYVVIPNVFYLYRISRKGSATTEGPGNFDAPKLMRKYSSTLKRAINYLDEFLDRHEIFSNRADLKYVLFNFFEAEIMPRLDNVYHATSSHALDQLLRREFDNSALAAFLFNTMNDYRLQLAKSKNRVALLENSIKNFVGKAIPAVSVIIPMYNSEKYIGELLDSLLAQTFQNFEVIVVDDCSTDNSRAVVVSYAPKFKNGQLLLSITAKNTGSPGDPSNLGVDLSRGEYLLILDHDDAITPDALEKLYVSAKTFNADVVTCEYFYLVPEKSWNDAEFRKNLKPHSYKEGDFVSEPTLMPFDVAERVRSCYEREFLWPLWSKFIRREFLIESKIRFTNNIIQDFLATCCMIYTARRFLRVPYVVNLWRMRDASLSNQKREPLKKFQKYLRALTVGIEYLNGFLSGIEFFQQNPEQRNIALKTYAREVMKYYVQGIYKDVPLAERYETLRKEFAGSGNAALTEVCFNSVADSANNVEINKANSEIIDKFKNYFTARVDIQRRVKAGDFQIVSISDDKADVKKPTWINKDGIGYQIQSYAGKMDIVAKSTADGQIKLILRGLDIKDAKDKSKRIPYWIDYTKFTVNGKVIFDKLTSTWHDEPYRYNMNVKADEEVKIQVEWLPHNGDAPTIAPPKVSPIDDKFLPFITGRLDIQLKPQGKGDFQILSTSDNNATVGQPAWLQKDGIGYQIQSYAGKMGLVAKATNDGQIKLILRGLDIKDAKDESKRIPYWIDYTKLIVNGKIIFDKVMPVCHDKPYRHNFNVKAGDEIKVQVEWLPHRSDA